MPKFKHIDLFSGIGGFALAASWVWPDHEVVCFCEMDPFCKKVLNKHWPGTPIVEDVNDVERIRKLSPTTVDLLTGGFPCQGFSVAGKQRGKEDHRYLWPQMLEVIKAVRPRWCLLENVTGIIKLALDTVLADLEAEGYTCGVCVLPACSKNAPHRRDRVWIVAHDESQFNGKHNPGTVQGQVQQPGIGFGEADVANTEREGCVRRSGHGRANENGRMEKSQQTGEEPRSAVARCSEDTGRPAQRRLGRVTHELPQRLDDPWGPGWEDGTPRVTTGQKDRVNRLKALGNSIVPQVVYEIMMEIKEVEKC